MRRAVLVLLATMLGPAALAQQPAPAYVGSAACTTCHTDFEEFGRYEVAEVTFPSGATVSLPDGGADA